MNDFPSISPPTSPSPCHNLDISVPWYRTRLFGADPVLDDDTGPFRHVVWSLGDTLLGLHQFPDGDNVQPFDERRPGLDHVRVRLLRPRRPWRSGSPGSTSSASPMATSSTRPTAPACRSATRTTSHSSSSPLPADPGRRRHSRYSREGSGPRERAERPSRQQVGLEGAAWTRTSPTSPWPAPSNTARRHGRPGRVEPAGRSRISTSPRQTCSPRR